MSQVHSMTGFAAANVQLPDGRSASVTIKSVNHRHLDLALRLPAGYDALEAGMRQRMKAAVARGHVEVTLTVERLSAAGELTLNSDLLGAYAKAFREAAEIVGVTQEPQVEALLRLPGVLSASAAGENVAAQEPAVHVLLTQALLLFNAARLNEGEALAAELLSGMQRIAALAQEASVLRSGVAAAEFSRLKLRMTELLNGAEVSEDRLLQEAALLAGRGDVEEELVRLRTHVERFTDLLQAGGEVGRQLDFLLQEMNREANTTLSKTGSSAGEAGLRLTEIGLAIKMELERAREQVQNLE